MESIGKNIFSKEEKSRKRRKTVGSKNRFRKCSVLFLPAKTELRKASFPAVYRNETLSALTTLHDTFPVFSKIKWDCFVSYGNLDITRLICFVSLCWELYWVVLKLAAFRATRKIIPAENSIVSRKIYSPRIFIKLTMRRSIYYTSIRHIESSFRIKLCLSDYT